MIWSSHVVIVQFSFCFLKKFKNPYTVILGRVIHRFSYYHWIAPKYFLQCGSSSESIYFVSNTKYYNKIKINPFSAICLFFRILKHFHVLFSFYSYPVPIKMYFISFKDSHVHFFSFHILLPRSLSIFFFLVFPSMISFCFTMHFHFCQSYFLRFWKIN